MASLARPLAERLHLGEEGQALAEYLMVTFAVVVIVAGVAWAAYQAGISGLFERLVEAISTFNP
jgi:hypothetical protein